MGENAARLEWSGAGLGLPNRFLGATTLRWAVQRLLERETYSAKARAIAEWASRNDGAARAAELVEEFAERMRSSRESPATLDH